MSLIEHVLDIIGLLLARTAGGAHNKNKLWLQVEVIWNVILQNYIQSLYDSMPRRDVYRLSSLSVADTQSTDFRRSFCFFGFVNFITYL